MKYAKPRVMAVKLVAQMVPPPSAQDLATTG